MGLFQDEYRQGHWDTPQQVRPQTIQLQVLKWTQGQEFRNLKQKDREKAILQLDKWRTPQESAREKGDWKMPTWQFLTIPGGVRMDFLGRIRMRLFGAQAGTMIWCLQLTQQLGDLWNGKWEQASSAEAQYVALFNKQTKTAGKFVLKYEILKYLV